MGKTKVEEEMRSEMSSEDTENYSPEGLRVIVVDGDVACLSVLHTMLRQCDYNVTSCSSVSEAIALVTERRDRFDIILCDIFFPGLYGFEFLDAVASAAINLPFIMMSKIGETSIVMQAITKGACDFLRKPIRHEELRNIWQHVVRLRLSKSTRRKVTPGIEPKGDEDTFKAMDSTESISSLTVDCNKQNNCYNPMIQDTMGLKKARMHWTVGLHNQFVQAVRQLGLQRAAPKKILERMNVQGLTREKVSSHLQKYRVNLKRLSGRVPEARPVASFHAATDGKSGGKLQIQERHQYHCSTNSKKIKANKKICETRVPKIPTTYPTAPSSNNNNINISIQSFDEVAASSRRSNNLSVTQNAGSVLASHHPFVDEAMFDNIAEDCGFTLASFLQEDFNMETVVNAEEARKPVSGMLLQGHNVGNLQVSNL